MATFRYDERPSGRKTDGERFGGVGEPQSTPSPGEVTLSQMVTLPRIDDGAIM